jgi:hypothetical protein
MAGFDAGWELDLFGRYQRSLDAARDDAEAQMELRNAVLVTVIADVAHNYLDIRGLQMRLEIARKDRRNHWNGNCGKRSQQDSKYGFRCMCRRDPRPERIKFSFAWNLLMTRSDRGLSNESDLTSTKPGVRPQKRQSKSSASKELDLTLAKGELAIQQARLPELNAAISAAESRLAVCSAPMRRTSPGQFGVLRNCRLFPSVCVPERQSNCCGTGRISARPSASSRRRPHASGWRPQTCSRRWR